MHRLKKISLWTGGILGFMLSIYLVALLILPRFIDSESVKGEIQSQFSQMLGGRIMFERLELEIWPIPHIEIRKVQITIPPNLSSTVQASKIYPKILPLLTGRVEIGVVRFESPVLGLRLMDAPAVQEAPSRSFEFMNLGKRLAATMAILPKYTLPDLKFEIRNGNFNLSDANQNIFELQEIQAVFKGPLNDRQLKLRCRSNLWQDVSLNAHADITDLAGSGRIEMRGFAPRKLLARVLLQSGWQITEGRSDLNIQFKAKLPDRFNAEIAGSIPYLNLQHAGSEVRLKGQRLKANFGIEDDRLILSILDLVLEKPKLKISGEMQIASQDPGIRVRVQGRRIDVNSLRSSLSGLIGKNAGLRNVFRIIREGNIPLVTAEARGKSLRDLINTKNIAIRGRMNEAKIRIPGLELELDQVSGNAVIAGEILQATNLTARLGGVAGRNGELDLTLTGYTTLFQLATGFQADLSQLPPVLEKLIKEKNFRRELSRISRLTGQAAGELMIDNTDGELRVQVKADINSLTTQHRNIPVPVSVSNGNITYERNRLHVEQFQGKVGQSSFSNLTADTYWGREPYLTVRSGTCRFHLKEIYSALQKSTDLADRLNDIESVDGVMAVSTLRLQGPLFRPKVWMLDLKGEPKNLSVKLKASPEVIQANGGNFQAVDQALARKVYLTDHHITLADSSFKASGTIDSFQTSLDGVDLTIDGNLSTRGINWISDIFKLPSEFKPRSPVLVSGAHLAWHTADSATFSGDFAVRDGPSLTADVLFEPGRLNVKKLKIQDSRSRAVVSLLVQSRRLSFSFKGNVQRQTVDELLVFNEILQGSIRGDLRADIHLNQPRKSMAIGRLEAKRFSLPWQSAGSMTLVNLSVTGAKNRLNVNSAEIAWIGSHLNLAGKMDFKARHLVADFDIKADEINWEIWRTAFERDGPKVNKKQSSKTRPIPIKGVLHLKTNRFRYQNLIWSPWQADLYFNPEAAQLKIIQADLCGISTRGNIKIHPREVSLQIKPDAREANLQKTLFCLFGETYLADGRFDLTGDVKARATTADLLESLGGKLEFESKDGRIYRDPTLKKTLALLNITEVFLGRIPDFSGSGMSYKKLSFTAKLKKGKMVFKKIYLDSPAMKVTGQGTLDILTRNLDFNIIVAPLRTFDRVLGIIPLVGGILQTILTVPVKVEGDINDPKVTLMDPTVVRSELTERMQDTFKNPIKLIYPGLK